MRVGEMRVGEMRRHHASVVKLSIDRIYNSRAACAYHNVPQEQENTDPTYNNV